MYATGHAIPLRMELREIIAEPFPVGTSSCICRSAAFIWGVCCRAMRLRTLPVFMTFFVMGVADAMGPMADAVRGDYRLSNVLSTLSPFSVFVAFAVFSVPGGILGARIGKKRLLLFGLAISGVGVLVPALRPPGFALLLA